MGLASFLSAWENQTKFSYPVNTQEELAIYARYVFNECRSITRAGGGGWALEIDTFLGPVIWHQAIRQVPFGERHERGNRVERIEGNQ